jgi:hypothetical protein
MVERKPSWRLDDASLTAKENPYTFYKPSAAAISLLRPGNLAKLVFAFDSDDPEAPGAERMWVRIDRIESRRFFGVLDNDPLFIRDLKAGDPIEFDDRHVIQTDIADPEPDPTASYRARCFVTKRVLDGEAPAKYLYREAPDSEDDSGWRITAGDEADEYMDDPENCAYVSLGAVLRRDDSFRDLLDTRAPCAYWRNTANEQFEPVEPPEPA